jgi:putative hydrolases of HD superfamily
MKNIVNLLFEARKLKHIPRSGYQFLEAGRESVAEHCFLAAFIAYAMAQLIPDMGPDVDCRFDRDKLVRMCLLHDLAEARTGDLNYVQKKYVAADEQKALEDALQGVAFGSQMMDLLHEFREGKTVEAKLAKDADQIAFLLDLKALDDRGFKTSQKWIDHVSGRLKTPLGKKLFVEIMQTNSDAWWLPGG